MIKNMNFQTWQKTKKGMALRLPTTPAIRNQTKSSTGRTQQIKYITKINKQKVQGKFLGF